MNSIKLNNKNRRELWDDMGRIEFKIKELKGIFQNEIPIIQEVVDQFITEKDEIINQLNKLQDNFEVQVKAEELFQKIIK
ncbi:MAG: hypothetical protein E6182_10110 [Clostridioides difficile]|nr:hypothetical protein [Clostridioides difficile]